MNKSITIIFIWSIFLGSILMQPAACFAQERELNPPTNLNATVIDDNDVTLTWDAPNSGGDPILLHWDSGVNEDSWGFWLSAEQFDVAAKWDPIHIASYDGWTITKLRFYVISDAPTIQLKIWSGPNATEIYSQDVPTFNEDAWTEIELDSPVTIDAGTQLWAGLNIDMPMGNPIMGTDGGPAIDGYGNNYTYQGVWYNDATKNWNIQIEVEDPTRTGNRELLGYNVYRDDDQINGSTVTATSYLDENLLNGTYEYFVTALYDDGESDPSNTVQVIIDQPGILVADSLALVDLYNSCDGANWQFSENWLTGPVNEWYGVTTTGVRVTSLFLANNTLSGTIPESIGDLDALENLHLESNDLYGALPQSIGNLTELTEFWVGFQNITGIPSSIGNLVNLEQLHIGFTNLGSLPESFGNLESLDWLALGDAGLNSLPSSFGNLTTVTSCFLWGNNLTELPEYIGGMTNLTYLSVAQNQLTSLPESIGDLDNLGWLYLEDNQLTTLPESFGDLESLDTLHLEQNQLTSLPESFGNLSDLNYVRLSINNLTEFPSSFSNLATIEDIYADQNQLQSLPEDIGNLTTLRALSLSGNNIAALPESMSDLTLLYALFAVDNQIGNIPVNIGNISGLAFLALDNNNIEVVPVSIGNISGLGYISLGENNITSLPETFGDLEADTVLINNNNIDILPASMFDNTFDYLWIEDNALQFGSIEPFIGNVSLEYKYTPQDDFGSDTTIYLATQGVIDFTWEVSGDHNVYQWYKDGEPLEGQTTNTLLIYNVSMDDNGVYNLKVTNTQATALTLWSKDVTVDAVVTDIQEEEELMVKIYPNPANGDYVTIALTNGTQSYRIQVLNTTGRIVTEMEMRGTSNQLNITSLPKGMYFIKLTDERKNQKVIKFNRN